MSDPFRLERARRRPDPPGELQSAESCCISAVAFPPGQLYFSLRHHQPPAPCLSQAPARLCTVPSTALRELKHATEYTLASLSWDLLQESKPEVNSTDIAGAPSPPTMRSSSPGIAPSACSCAADALPTLGAAQCSACFNSSRSEGRNIMYVISLAQHRRNILCASGSNCLRCRALAPVAPQWVTSASGASAHRRSTGGLEWP